MSTRLLQEALPCENDGHYTLRHILIQGSIYLVRTAIVSYYNYRINIITARLSESQNERTKTINKLKEATKYNSTQQLLEKYGEVPRTEPPSRTTTSDVVDRKATLPVRRTGLNPPATANISRQNTPSQPNSPHSPQQRSEISQVYPQTTSAMQEPSLEPGFAPNAFEERQYESRTRHESRWYDRIFDLLLGDDETSAKNRMVLICKHCRLVNGQAPPGIKRVEDVGKWRCIACHKMNGEEDEGRRMVAEMKERLAVTGSLDESQPTQKTSIARDSDDSEISEEEINIRGRQHGLRTNSD